MPALTHGRVINGFNSQPRSIKYSQRLCDPNNPDSNKCVKDKVCTVPRQPLNMKPTSGLLKRYHSAANSRDKLASTIATGRSFAAKRAIARRVSKQRKEYHNIEMSDGTTEKKKVFVCDLCHLPSQAPLFEKT